MPYMHLILLVLALVLFLMATFAPEPWVWRQRVGYAGLAAWVASTLFFGHP